MMRHGRNLGGPFWTQDVTLDSEFLGAVSLMDHVATSLARLSWLGTRCLWYHVAWAKDEAASAPCLSLSFFFLFWFCFSYSRKFGSIERKARTVPSALAKSPSVLNLSVKGLP